MGRRTIPAPMVVAIPIPPGLPQGFMTIWPRRKNIIPTVAIQVGYPNKIMGRVMIKPFAISIKKTDIPYRGPISAYIFEAPGLPVPRERISTFLSLAT
tara:strand:+ start:766 stop:1059 length:294 start_codon:yes stop_codon:yes gene_type:complete